MILRTARHCDQAYKMAMDCSWGSSADVQILSAVNSICVPEMYRLNPSTQERQALDRCQKLCLEKYADQEGSMYRSFTAFCWTGLVNKLIELKEAQPDKNHSKNICEIEESIPLS